MNNRFLQIAQVSNLLEISETTPRQSVQKGVLPAIRIRRQIRIDERRFQEWLEAGGSGSTGHRPRTIES
jgi:excisionase family DNA binding protein